MWAVISNIGNLLLLITMASSIGAIITKRNFQLFCFYCSAFAALLSLLLLVSAFVSSDFSLKNVFLNSSSELPLIYKIAASWSSHEGSILFWHSLLCLVGVAYIKFSGLSNDARSFSMIVFSIIQLLFISFIIFTSNPFVAFAFIPKQGLGLNPMLQDVAISIHPPILYLGNACYAALFTGALTILYKPNEVDVILPASKNFSNLALLLLTIGIGLGSWWAYRELGWGGYWFFDAVENISLLPWLSGIALHHFLIIYFRNKKYLKWVIFLSILNFFLSHVFY
jgi:cytochrome c-type biogenesis protein CcmF